MSRFGGCFGCENILLEEALTSKLFQVPSEASTMDGLVALVSCKHVDPHSDLGHERRLHVETSTFLRSRQASRSDWRKSSLPPPTKCDFITSSN